MEDTPTTPPPNPPPHTPPSEDFLSWSNWFRMLTGRMSLSERKTYLWAHDIKHEASDCRRCADHVSFLYKYSPTIRFLRENIQQLHSDLPPSAVHCRRCTPPAPGKIGQYGGFSPHHGIMLCANEAVTRAEVEDALAHEMVHAYDHLRFRVDWADLRHAACTEIRASSLGGECRWAREFWARGQRGVVGHHQECVRRRAILSVRGRPKCLGEEHAARVVDEVWASCFADTRPFDEIYR